jgi:hypothetical protein
MARKGIRKTSQSRYIEIDVGDGLRMPIMPFLAILRVTQRNFYHYKHLSKQSLSVKTNRLNTI